MFSLFKRKPLLSQEENQQIVKAIQEAELNTSGDIRVYLESRCKFMDPLDRAKEVFAQLKMGNTEKRNGVLLYIALKDRQLAVFGDAGIHEKTGEEYWQQAVNLMVSHFNKENYVEGICACVKEIGDDLKDYFPYDKDTNRNELPDDIVFGR